jgi:hypothetical protein
MITADLGQTRSSRVRPGIGMATAGVGARRRERGDQRSRRQPRFAETVDRLKGEGSGRPPWQYRRSRRRAAHDLHGDRGHGPTISSTTAPRPAPSGRSHRPISPTERGILEPAPERQRARRFRCVETAAPHLKKTKGAIVSTASNSAFYGGGASSPYCATKAAIVTLTREWARALAPEVRVNAVAPGWVEGSNWECKWTDDENSKTHMLIPLGRPGHISEYAEAIFFLLAGGSVPPRRSGRRRDDEVDAWRQQAEPATNPSARGH